MKTRREFLKDSSLLLAAIALSPVFSKAALFAHKKIGIQLYTLRDIIDKDVQGVIEKIAQIGFKEVETYGFEPKTGFWNIQPKDFKKILDNNGLTAPSGHYAYENFIDSGKLDDLKPHIEAANILNSKYVVLPWLSTHNRKGIDAYKHVAERLNQAGEYCKSQGMLAAYHNHEFEFNTFNGKSGLEIMLDETDKNLVHFELDLYWSAFVNKNPLELFNKYPKRFKMWHIKDMDKQNRTWNTEIGKGTVNFKDIFTAAKQSGVKHLYLEQETNYQPNYLASIKTSFDYINNNLINL